MPRYIVLKLLSALFIQIMFTFLLYSQTLLGSRWILPKKYKKKGFDFYKTESEIKSMVNDAENKDCLICLSPILSKLFRGSPEPITTILVIFKLFFFDIIFYNLLPVLLLHEYLQHL